MMQRRSNSLVFAALAVLFILDSTNAFTSSSRPTTAAKKVTTTIPSTDTTTTTLYQFGKKKKTVEDLSFIETRDLTREEMLNINKRNEEVMNRELQAMTGISVLFSIPILYLCWVAFFSD
jgi:selenocysteine-specific elongation factor